MRKHIFYSFLFCILLCFFTTGCGVRKEKKVAGNSKKTEKVVKYATKFNGTKYRYGGKSPKSGFDCSGFICYVYKEIDVHLPASSKELSKKGKNVSLKKVQKGDLLFFKGSNKKNKKVGHVALVTENKAGKIKMIHATTSRGVITETYNASSYWTSRFLFARRIIN